MPTIYNCLDCPYRESGPAIGPRGDPASRIVLVGEAPGAKEIVAGQPFIGPAGSVLSEALAKAHIDEESVFITNTVACRPLNPAKPIRTPSSRAVLACRGRLVRDISAHDRAVIVALGATAIRAVTGRSGFLVTKKEPGTELRSVWGPVVPTLHPAFVLRRGLEGPEYQMLVADLQHARRLAFGSGSGRVEMKAPNVPGFRPRFPLSEVMYWAARYAYADDAEVEAIGVRARERGWYTRDEFLTVARWKSPRSRRRCEENDEATVKEMTQRALSTPDERGRIEALIQLRGVEYPTASVLLHLAHRDPYPIIDYRALWSLGIESPPAAYSFKFWWAYVEACRSLATDAGVRMRTFDRALWQFSKERQPPKDTAPADDSALAAPPPAERSESKSAAMRRMYAEGLTVSEAAKATNASYGHAYDVRKRWLAAQTEPSGQRSGGQGVPGRVEGSVGTRALGIVATDRGWFAVLLVDGYFGGADFRPSVSDLLARFPDAVVVAIDIPIGLPRGLPRPADVAARAFVDPEGAATEFANLRADVRASSTYVRAYKLAVGLRRTGIPRRTSALGDRIREVAEVAATDPRIVEVHPEVSFRALRGEPLRYSEQGSWSGFSERRALLARAGILLPDDLPGGRHVKPESVLDAAAAAWSAVRVAEGRSATLPAKPSGDPADGGVIRY